jgi:hypothetical protein
MLVWYTANDWYRPLSDAEEGRLIHYLEDGGRVFLSSQDYLYYGHGHSLAHDYLGVLDYDEGPPITQARGESKHPIGWGIGPYTLVYTYPNWSDVLIPAPDTQVAFRNEHALPTGVTRSEGERRTASARALSRTAFLSFPFETLDPGVATTVMARTVGWLSWLGASTWEADRRTVADGDEVTMTCALHNDGWAAIASAHLSATLPADLSLVAGPTSAGTVVSPDYYPLTRTVVWQGDIAQNGTVTVSFRVQVANALPDATYISFPAHIGYEDHHIRYERPYILRINAPDLSSSTLVVDRSTTPPRRTLTYTLSIINTGVRSATAVLSTTIPAQTEFVGTLDSGGVGSGQIVSRTLNWTGPVAEDSQVTLRYRVYVNDMAEYWLAHQAQLKDQYDEEWNLYAPTKVQPYKSYYPLTFRKE